MSDSANTIAFNQTIDASNLVNRDRVVHIIRSMNEHVQRRSHLAMIHLIDKDVTQRPVFFSPCLRELTREINTSAICRQAIKSKRLC